MPTSKSRSQSRSGGRQKKYYTGYSSKNSISAGSINVEEIGLIDKEEMNNIGFAISDTTLKDSAPIESVKGIGVGRSNKFRSMGITTVGDLRRFDESQQSRPVRIKAGKLVDSVLVNDEKQGIFSEVNKPISNVKKDNLESKSFTNRKTVIANRLEKSSIRANQILDKRNKVNAIQNGYKKQLAEQDSQSSNRYDKRKADLKKKVREFERTGEKDYWESQEYEEKKSAEINRDYEYSDLSPKEMRDMMVSINKDFEANKIEPSPFYDSTLKQKTRSGLWSDLDRFINYDYYDSKAVDKSKIIVDQMNTPAERSALAEKWSKRELRYIDEVRFSAKHQKQHKKDFEAIEKELDSAKTLDEVKTIEEKSNRLAKESEENSLNRAKTLTALQKEIRQDYETAYIDDRSYKLLVEYTNAVLDNENITVGISSKINLSHKFKSVKENIRNNRGKEEVLIKLNDDDLMSFPKTVGRASSNQYIRIKDTKNNYTYYYNTDKKVSKISKTTYDKALKDVITYYNNIDVSKAGKDSAHSVNYEYALMEIRTFDYIPNKYRTELGNNFIVNFPSFTIGEKSDDNKVKYLLSEQASVGFTTKYEFDNLNGFGYTNFDKYDNDKYQDYEKAILNYKIRTYTDNKEEFEELRFHDNTSYDLKNIKGFANMLGYKAKNNDYRPLFEKLLEDKKIMVNVGESYPFVVKFDDNHYGLIAPIDNEKED